MPYIYQITNLINGKQYVGKTLKTVEERWREHKGDYLRSRNEKRPLYSAMRKYGINNFKVEVLEEVNEESVNEREIYWIESLRTFKYGYNATKGGDGKSYLDYDMIYGLFDAGLNLTQIQKQMNCCEDQVRNILVLRGITSEQIRERGILVLKKPVAMCDKDTKEVLKIFSSMREAGRFLNKKSSDWHISEVCKGKRKTAYGYSWKFI